ncbi:hypothetical protein Ndes2526B_g05982 [Nannochloris sp. 'desiccata']|nr:hypothetical protein KSW81_007787 [Chlorella desiccata (nom. nud.)]
MIHKLAFSLAWLALIATCSAQEPNCEGLSCDNCPVYRDANDFIYVELTTECVLKNGKAELTCRCADPPEGALPAARDAPSTDDGEAEENGSDDIDDLPPDGGSGSRIPTQSYGTSNAAKASPFLFPATVAAIAAAIAFA